MLFAAIICMINEEPVCPARGSLSPILSQITPHSSILMSKLMKPFDGLIFSALEI
jgi:hypothetical protein